MSGEDGSFTIEKLPPGNYTLDAWHEKLGTSTKAVTVAPNQTVDVDLRLPAEDRRLTRSFDWTCASPPEGGSFVSGDQNVSWPVRICS